MVLQDRKQTEYKDQLNSHVPDARFSGFGIASTLQLHCLDDKR